MSDHLALTFLGVGSYQPTTYELDGKTHTTRYMADAISTLVDPDQMAIFMTPEAARTHAEQVRKRCDFEAVSVQPGADAADWWDVFEVVADTVPASSRLTVDVTHGFRSQPLLALAVVLYLRVAKGAKVERIIYGAFEARDESTNRTPIMDLTAVVDLVDWSVATQQFLAYGDAQPLRTVFHVLKEESRKGDEVALNLGGAGNQLEILSRALALNRPIEAISASEGFISALEKALQDTQRVPQARPLQRLVLALANRFAPLSQAEGSVFTDRGFKAQAAMLRLYLETEQYLHAFTLAQEMLVSWVCVQSDFNPKERGTAEKDDQGNTVKRKGRKGARDLLHEWSSRKNAGAEDGPGENALKVASWWDDLRDLRNDVAHAGFQYNPESAADLAQAADEKITKVVDFFS